ncbi:type II toxin-antitoxin system mRNA interferase toxin, RelE/StbE family [Levilactobacillus tujiorum]|uniref:type II toxin-antitoxin system mRNA interferase toxin, RelE/StbE family n=1 Tax=Levilactobacillus tujiorum TaxID=2912243 RepID=UPI0014575326|nr:type II toxin-antitoxin system mRNA interferase toxin, RelE/StbE family [Levilactobacillus tujiorum]
MDLQHTPKFDKHLNKYLDETDINLFKTAVSYLKNSMPLPESYDDHQLRYQKKGIRDFHLQSDTVVVYYLIREKSITFIDVGPHSLLFKVKKDYLSSSVKRLSNRYKNN